VLAESLPKPQAADADPAETAEWRESIDSVAEADGKERAGFVLGQVLAHARARGIPLGNLAQTPYINTIPPELEAAYPGDVELERKIRRALRWNAVAMVVRANKHFAGIGGHISTYASSAMLYEVGFNHFFRGKDAPGGGDQIFIQGHGSPGIYARAFLEGRLRAEQLDLFRRDTQGGITSYPHPWLMPEFWEFTTVSMGLGPIGGIYQARFNRYLHNRGLKDTSNNRVWCFLGDGECDEPEALGALGVAAREELDNLVFVINCNLQRLDGPVRGNGKIIQELEGTFSGAGWNVIKVVWGPEWDDLFARDSEGLLQKRLGEVVDGQFQKYCVEPGSYMRHDLFGTDQRLLALVNHLSDEQLLQLSRGGHSHQKVYTAYERATTTRGKPTVVLAHTIKGYGLGEGFAASNVTHQQKKLEAHQLKRLRDALELPIPDGDIEKIPFFHPGEKSPEVEYLRERRRALGGPMPARRPHKNTLAAPTSDLFGEFKEGGKANVEVSTTMAFVRLLRKLLRDKAMGKHVVPIIPDEARTFGMDPLFKEVGIYSAVGQKYEPVDAKMLLSYYESQSGQLLEEGITEAGAMASFTAAGTTLATHGVTTIPFYIFYSMFGLQRTGDQAWAFGDMRGRGFLLGATAGRTTLHGEGLQHDDGHSHLFANAYPTMLAYDPAYAYEVAIIVQDGLRRMLERDEDVFYYITLYNENYLMPPMPEGSAEGILKGMYLLKAAPGQGPRVQLFGSGTILQNVLAAQRLLADSYGVAADVWSVTSYQQLYREARAVERDNRLHPERKPRTPYIATALEGHAGPVVTASDWVSELPSLVSRFVPRRFLPLGTNGFGRSDTRENLRKHFEVDPGSIVCSALYALSQEGKVEPAVVARALKEHDVRPDKQDPLTA
jgi:pyruvate dehydrogenase E1 component